MCNYYHVSYLASLAGVQDENQNFLVVSYHALRSRFPYHPICLPRLTCCSRDSPPHITMFPHIDLVRVVCQEPRGWRYGRVEETCAVGHGKEEAPLALVSTDKPFHFRRSAPIGASKITNSSPLLSIRVQFIERLTRPIPWNVLCVLRQEVLTTKERGPPLQSRPDGLLDVVVLPEVLQAVTIRHRRANPLRKLPRANRLLDQRLDLLPIYRHRYLLYRYNKARHVPRAKTGAD